MNKPSIDFYFDFISPYSYLAATRIPTFEQQYHIRFNWLPISLPQLMLLSGNTSPAAVKNKAIYSLRDLKRWAAYLDVPFKMIRPGSFDSTAALSISSALEGDKRVEFNLALFDALWSGLIDPKSEGWLHSVFDLKGLAREWLKLQSDTFETHTQSALKAGAFGAPTFVLHPASGRSEIFFGVDHMELLAHSCKNISASD